MAMGLDCLFAVKLHQVEWLAQVATASVAEIDFGKVILIGITVDKCLLFACADEQIARLRLLFDKEFHSVANIVIYGVVAQHYCLDVTIYVAFGNKALDGFDKVLVALGVHDGRLQICRIVPIDDNGSGERGHDDSYVAISAACDDCIYSACKHKTKEQNVDRRVGQVFERLDKSLVFGGTFASDKINGNKACFDAEEQCCHKECDRCNHPTIYLDCACVALGEIYDIKCDEIGQKRIYGQQINTAFALGNAVESEDENN